ncbi:hypothetical protein [Fulvivirga lutimaris]|uniref:hypothetical protein n=1 Tax=Fulvivirga lutimaris TaxID=1819566 RepID=UPI0012BD1D3E|nr:hypothetical protein [Fulvivirga lutimaris]MTI40859.1 hypothetical protein [Fulvivirga lutimaris]
MNRKVFIVLPLIIATFINFCYSANSNAFGISKEKFQDGDSISITISAINLSEDLSVISTKNDELFILIYELKDTIALGEPVLQKQFNVDKSNPSRLIHWNNFSRSTAKKYLLILVERDSDISTEQIEPVLRVYHKEISDAFRQKNYSEIEKYLGDDDVLGFYEFSVKELSNNSFIKFKGTYKMDRYEYIIHFE